MSKINLKNEKYNDLTKERQDELAAALKQCESDEEKYIIYEELTNRHLRLVNKLATSYTTKTMEYDDLFSAGALALWRSVITWDMEYGPLFPWALRWIKTAMNREVDGNRKIKIPEEIAYKRALAEKYKHESDMSEIDIANKLEITVEKLHYIRTLPVALNIIDTPEEDGGGIGSYIKETGNNPSDLAEINEIKEYIYSSLELLTPIEKEVMISRFGLNGDKKKTLNEIGVAFSVGREAMRRIEAGAIAKMRHPSFPINLNALLDN